MEEWSDWMELDVCVCMDSRFFGFEVNPRSVWAGRLKESERGRKQEEED